MYKGIYFKLYHKKTIQSLDLMNKIINMNDKELYGIYIDIKTSNISIQNTFNKSISYFI